jgi:hypothetical protein
LLHLLWHFLLQLDKLTRQVKLLVHGQFFNLVNILSRKQLAQFYVQVCGSNR